MKKYFHRIINIPAKFCSGCGACQAICPKQCISMAVDSEGFFYPYRNTNKCVKCHLCEKVCPVLEKEKQRTPLKTMFGKHLNAEIRKNSSSGGVFYALAEKIIDNGGIVYGAAFSNDNSIKHIRISVRKDLTLLQGTKYVQSSTEGIFKLVENDLQKGLNVLFSGTPCQIAGLQKFLRKKYDNLLSVEVVCHGVPSPAVWARFLEEEKNKIFKSTPCTDSLNRNDIDISVKDINFRDKRDGWRNYGLSFKTSIYSKSQHNDSLIFYDRFKNSYMKGFLGHLFLRPSCHNCFSKNFASNADLTIGDAWGIEHYTTSFDDDLGISLIIINTIKGETALSAISTLTFSTMNDYDFNAYNPAIIKSVKTNRKRHQFFKLFNKGELTLDEIINKLLPPPTYLDKVIWSILQKAKFFLK